MNNLLTELRHRAMQMTASQPSEDDNPFIIHKTYEEFLTELILDECCNVIIDSDPSPKMILHEPYRTIMDNLINHFGLEE